MPATPAADRHAEDTSIARAGGQVRTWCNETVPATETTTIPRAITCPRCRAAMGLPELRR